MTGALSPSHWLIILVVLLLLFGAKRLPDAARGIGRSLRIFKAETSALSEDEKAAKAEKDAEPAALEPTPAAAPTPTHTSNGSRV
ncbi:Sec-independent protein translocase subunit TatA [Actinomycetospora flava]|uniref:Sec-independent protein translocase protein TatA n=1 Tax=Actinomycetospora flava TaxID=3129232 RepID=A0ABU8M807_9PSEU